jgi:ATP-dependent Clp protease ATP-binding subunit ClpC
MPFKFFSWHYSEGIRKFLSIWKNFIDYFWIHFSVGLLLRTLLFPWKRDVSRVMQRGFHPVLFVQNFFINSVTRILGLIIKTFVILFALSLEILTLLSGFCFFLIWLAFPLFFITSLVFLLALDKSSMIGLSFWGIILALSFVSPVLSFLSFKKGDSDYFSLDILTLAQKKWFSRIWDRAKIDSHEITAEILTDKKLLENFLTKFDLTVSEFEEIVRWETQNQIDKEKAGRFWLRENLFSKKPIGKYWSFAYTVKLDRYTSDLSLGDYTQYRDAKLIGKENDLSELKLLLTRQSQSNVILIGETGVGKDTIVHTLAREIRNNTAGPLLNNKRILSLDLKEVTSSQTEGSADSILQLLFSEAAYAGNVILFIKDIHQYLKNNPQNEGEDISAILSEFLSLPTFQIIGTTTPSEFHSNVEKKSGVMKYCEKIQVEEMPANDTLKVMLYKLKDLENKRVVFTFQALREIIKLCERYITDSPFPEKALDMLEEVLLFWENNGSSAVIDSETVDASVSQKIKVPLGEMSGDESQKLLDLENILHQRVVGQEFAVKQIAETMRRARVGMANSQKPLGSFLFLGPTGVGKTESSKALAEAYFGDENRMIRLDMSEYQTQDSIDRLLGSTATGKEGYLVDKVKENPYSLLLLDEIEKAFPDILNLFLQVLDEGFLTDAFGKKISFRNLIIIATSNAASEIIRESIQSGSDPKATQEKVIDYAIKQGIFRPEFLNRFEGVIFFHPLNPDEIIKITENLLKKYATKLKSDENISVEFDPQLSYAISEKAFDPVFGARAIDRFIQDKIGDNIVKKIISGNIKKGQSFTFVPADIE